METGAENGTFNVILFPLIIDRFGGTFYLGGLLAATKKYTKGFVTFLLLECSGLENQFGCLARV